MTVNTVYLNGASFYCVFQPLLDDGAVIHRCIEDSIVMTFVGKKLQLCTEFEVVFRQC